MLNKKGLTMADAGRISTFLKETVKGIDIQTSNFAVITSETVRSGESYKLDSNQRIDNWKELLQQKARYYSLSAWLMEAVKLKESMLLEVRNMVFSKNIPAEELELYPEAPIAPKTTFDDFFKNVLNTKEKAEYLSNQSMAAHVGGFIHNFDNIRKTLDNFKPTTFDTISSSETLTVVNKLLYTKEELIEGTEELRKIHRDAEKIMNYYKGRAKDWADELSDQYQRDLEKYKNLYASAHKQNEAVVQKYKSEFEIEKTKKVKEIADLKIEIPKDLQPILDEVLEKLN